MFQFNTGVTLSIYDEVPKPTSVNVGKPSVDNALSDIPEGTRSCNSSMPASSTATIASETGTVNSNTYIKAEESLYEQPIEIYDLKKIELNLGGGNSSNGISFLTHTLNDIKFVLEHMVFLR